MVQGAVPKWFSSRGLSPGGCPQVVFPRGLSPGGFQGAVPRGLSPGGFLNRDLNASCPMEAAAVGENEPEKMVETIKAFADAAAKPVR